MFRLLENKKREELTEQLLESQDKAPVRNRSRVHIFFWDPNALGERLYTIIKFGLVQYVRTCKCFLILILVNSKMSHIPSFTKFQMILKSLCAFLSSILELFGKYGDGEFKWYYG